LCTVRWRDTSEREDGASRNSTVAFWPRDEARTSTGQREPASLAALALELATPVVSNPSRAVQTIEFGVARSPLRWGQGRHCGAEPSGGIPRHSVIGCDIGRTTNSAPIAMHVRHFPFLNGCRVCCAGPNGNGKDDIQNALFCMIMERCESAGCDSPPVFLRLTEHPFRLPNWVDRDGSHQQCQEKEI
jgi:hypothetical protein